jgi:hypothetical protein
LDQTWQKCSLGGLPSDLLFWCRSEIQLWKSSCHKIPSRWNCNIIEMMSMWSSTLYQVCYFCADRISKMATMTWLSLTLDPIGMPKSCIKNKIISSSSSCDIFNGSVNGRTKVGV